MPHLCPPLPNEHAESRQTHLRWIFRAAGAEISASTPSTPLDESGGDWDRLNKPSLGFYPDPLPDLIPEKVCGFR